MKPTEPTVEKSLEMRGYKWLSSNPEAIGKMIGEMLEKRHARCYMMDVYTTTGMVFRNLFCSWPDYNNLVERILRIRFKEDTGSSFSVHLETKAMEEKGQSEVTTEHIK